jgi:hypothetical protein
MLEFVCDPIHIELSDELRSVKPNKRLKTAHHGTAATAGHLGVQVSCTTDTCASWHDCTSRTNLHWY